MKIFITESNGAEVEFTKTFDSYEINIDEMYFYADDLRELAGWCLGKAAKLEKNANR